MPECRSREGNIAGPMRINIVTSGRFHVLDLARELSAFGHDVRFYSIVPRWRAGRFGLPPRCHHGLLPFVFPLVAASRAGPRFARALADRRLTVAIDELVARVMLPCDAFIGMSGLCVASARAARRKFGARVLLERGSRHILSQKAILDAIPGAARIHATDVSRELDGYEVADTIVVPSRHVEQSFLERGTSAHRLFRNPYGVDLGMFPPTARQPGPPTVLMVGTWSRRKGCDVLWEACESAGWWRLLHVGPVGDAPLPRSARFLHVDPVAQFKLVRYFAQADVLALASREEGLSLVQAQALACGVPVVCTRWTGGEDLREMAGPGCVTIVPDEDPAALRDAIANVLNSMSPEAGPRDLLGEARDRLSWAQYGSRYHRRLMADASTAVNTVGEGREARQDAAC